MKKQKQRNVPKFSGWKASRHQRSKVLESNRLENFLTHLKWDWRSTRLRESASGLASQLLLLLLLLLWTSRGLISALLGFRFEFCSELSTSFGLQFSQWKKKWNVKILDVLLSLPSSGSRSIIYRSSCRQPTVRTWSTNSLNARYFWLAVFLTSTWVSQRPKMFFIKTYFRWRCFVTSPHARRRHSSATAGQLAWLLTYETSRWLICRRELIFLAAASLIARINQTYWIINLFAWRWLIYLMASRSGVRVYVSVRLFTSLFCV